MTGGDLRTAVHDAPIERPLVVDLDDAAAIDAALTGGKAAALARGRHGWAGVAPRRRADHGLLGRHRCGREGGVSCRRTRDVRPCGRGPQGARRPQFVSGRGLGVVVDGRAVRLDHRSPRLRRLRRRGDGSAGLPTTGRSGRASDRGARPTAHRACIWRRDVRHRSGERPNRPPGRERRSRRAGAARQR